MNRRHFLGTAAALAAAPYVRARSGKTLRTALVGSGWWGMNILREALAAGRSNVVGVCDVDARTLTTAADEIGDAANTSPKKYEDFRELLDKEKPEIVIVATPDHWHGLPTVAALKAGAHVFVEKPTGHTVAESQAIVKAAKESGRVVQVGLHRRIGPHYVSGMKFLKDGGAGKVGMVRMFVTGGGGPERPSPNTDPPKKLNWGLYCGPAPMRPFNSKIHPGGWRNFLDFGNGQLGDWGVHWLDQVLWWADDPAPKKVFSTGGRPVRGPAIFTAKEQTTDAPDSQVAVYEFDKFTCVWEHRQFAANDGDKHKIGCYFHGTKGTFHMGWRDGWTFYPSNGREKVVHENAQLQEPDGHNIKLLWADFLKAIDSGSSPVANVERAHRATTAALLGMVSLKLDRSIAWDGSKEEVKDDAAANALLRREYRAPWVHP
ncbi:MAG TPA: Gfo/Idh/MocA family oxidoreductase [Gemmataceae bacterium]|nr:Gfo/Idh/MocA family oxidoreductase [Gemmataceae bacterium]